MFDPIDDLVQRWQQNPNPAMTVALCEALCEHPRGALVQQVGEFAKERHASDVSVMISVARMYIETSQFADAQTVLVAAGKRAPRDGRVYRWLGEVLLRRGDAERAEKVFDRAIQLGVRDAEVPGWLARARSYRSMQATAGPRAVAAEVAHSMRVALRGGGGAGAGGAVASAASAQIPRLNASLELDDGATTEIFERVDTAEIELSPAPPASTHPQSATRVERAPAAARAAAAASSAPAPGRLPAPTPPPASGALPRPGALPSPRPPAGRTNGAAVARSTRPARSPGATARPLVPHPRDVLDALSLAGVYETQSDPSAALAAWDRAARGPKRKGAPTLIVGMVLFLAGTVGVYQAYRHKRAAEHLQAEALLATVEAQLHAGKPDQLPEAEKTLARTFQLESRSPRAALDWTRERALMGLVKNGSDIAFEDAMARAKEVGIPEDKYAFARVASFLFQGDTAGAAAVLPRWEGPSAGDAWFQLVAGATLERAGDARARERYATAAKIDPELFVARVGLGRAAAIDGDAKEAMRLARELRAAAPDRAEPVALVALSWGRDPQRDDVPAPPEVDEVGKREEELPSGLRFVPRAIAAIQAIDKRGGTDPRDEIRRGLEVIESPGAAVWLGTISLPLGDEALSRKAALAALQLSAAYEPARALAARVALLGGRIDEALKATEDLDAATPEVAVIRAAAAYERLDADGVGRALEALPAASRKLPFLGPLGLAPDALFAKVRMDPAKLLAMGSDDAPWGDLLAMDVVLDGGDLATADKIAAHWGKAAESQPLRAVRLARLARYENRLDAADTLSQTALAHGTVTIRVLAERAYVLVARQRPAEVAALVARYPMVLGPLATWLSAYASASGGAVDAAKGKVSSVDPPSGFAPLEVRVAAAAALGAMKDRRRGSDYLKEALASAGLHPDLVSAALALGFHRVEHGRRPPTYEP